jgi:hypothetical protein
MTRLLEIGARVAQREISGRSFTTVDGGAPYAVDIDDYAAEGLRIGIFGSSGTGKGWLLGCIVEDMIALGLPVVMLDAEQELWTFKEVGALVVGGPHGDAPFTENARALDAVIEFALDTRTPVVFDVGELAEADEVEAFRLGELVMRRLATVADRRRVEVGFACTEAAIFAPETIERGQARARAMKALFQRGRKRGVIPVIDTQRMADIQKSLISQANVSFVGKVNKHVDYQPLRSDVGGRAFEEFRRLPTGVFFAQPANVAVQVRARRVTHGGGGPGAQVVIQERERVGLEEVLRLLRESGEAPEPEEAPRAVTGSTMTVSTAVRAEVLRLREALTAAQAERDQFEHLADQAEIERQAAAAALGMARERMQEIDALGALMRRVGLTGGEGGGNGTVDAGLVREVVREEIARLGPATGAPVLAPVEMLRHRYLEAAAERLVERVRTLDADQSETLLFLLAHPEGATINGVALGIAGNDGGGTRSRFVAAVGALVSAGLVKAAGSGGMKRRATVDEWVRSGLGAHNPTAEEIASVRDRALSLLASTGR